MSMAQDIEARRKRAKYLKYLREAGIPLYIPAGEAQEHVTRLRGRGMTCVEIAREAGVHYATLKDFQAYKKLPRDQINAILALEIPPPPLTREERKTGARRIMQGLMSAGFTSAAISRELGTNRHHLDCLRYTGTFGNKGDKARSISPENYEALVRLAGKLEGADPKDFGVEPRRSQQIIRRAKNQGYAPLGAWDLDMVHRESEQPEWTGACGTAEGYRIHKREGHVFAVHGSHTTFACDPCRTAFAEYRAEEKIAANGKMAAARLLREGRTVPEIVDELGVHPRTVERARKMLNGDPEELEKA